MPAEFSDRCDAIEECYEFMLAYAGQGLPSDEGSQAGGQVREFLQRAVNALNGLAESCTRSVAEQGLEPAAKYQAFIAVLEPRCPGFAGRSRIGAGPAVNQLPVDRQPERLDPSPRTAYRPVSGWRHSDDTTQTGTGCHELVSQNSGGVAFAPPKSGDVCGDRTGWPRLFCVRALLPFPDHSFIPAQLCMVDASGVPAPRQWVSRLTT